MTEFIRNYAQSTEKTGLEALGISDFGIIGSFD
jgi:hypothetical protein